MAEFSPEERSFARSQVEKLIEELDSVPPTEDAQLKAGTAIGYVKAIGDLEVIPWSECNSFIATILNK